jgi:hypothetical protein
VDPKKPGVGPMDIAGILWPVLNDEIVKPVAAAMARVALLPDEYTYWVNLCDLECDVVIHPPKVRKFVELMKHGHKFPPIQVIRHPLWPEVKLCAVLNGHHRFFAYKVLGRKRIKAIVIDGGGYGILYELTKRGVFQVNDKYQAFIRNPIEKWFRKKFVKGYDDGY